MKTILSFTIFLILFNFGCAQEAEVKKLVAMSDTYQKAYKYGSKYYEVGSDEPFTGVLYGKYDNGNYMTMQEYVDGIGNGKWIDFDPYGRKVCEGTYKDNRVEGPITFYYEDGSIKSKGQYTHWKRPIGEWTYYDKEGNVVSTMTFTR
ncbi:toxin-antitoxin system YwqK family antitoxin [Winogradskyella sp. MIT101101]|uniref:toxin-antitoxin system YwqK family antitoxin n=1 Tax=Winogradskyella sp. MIT101101 TaxID=3098297 RepID=UPI00399A8EF8